MIGITPRQAQCLDFIKAYLAKSGGVSPTFEEIAAGIGGANRSRVHVLINGLEARGRVRRVRGQYRSIEVVEMPEDRRFSAEWLAGLDGAAFRTVSERVAVEAARRGCGA